MCENLGGGRGQTPPALETAPSCLFVQKIAAILEARIGILNFHQTSTKKEASPIEKFKKIPLFKCKLQMKNCKQHCIMAGSKNLPNLPTDSSSKKLLMVGGVGVKNCENFADSLNRWSLEIWPLLQLLKVS